MKHVKFTKHALERLSRLEFYKTPAKNLPIAVRLLNQAQLVKTEDDITHYRRGHYRFVVKEHNRTMHVITIINES